MPQFNTKGWLRQPHDPRDRVYLAPRRITRSLPASADLSPGMGPQLDQADLGSCGPNTGDELVNYDQKAEGLPVVSYSRLFVYYNARVIMGTVNQDSGVDNRSMMQALATAGFCPETLWPYDTTQFTVQPPAACYQAGQANKITDYAAVPQDLTQMKGTLAAGRPFCFGFDVFSQIQSDQAAGNGIVADPSGSPIGGHDVSFVGFNDTGNDLPGVLLGNVWPSGYFKFRNHWMNAPGRPWGDGGYGYISYGYASGPNASDFWVISTVPGGVPTPGPGPSPTPAPTPGPTPTPGTLPAVKIHGGFKRPDGIQLSYELDFPAGVAVINTSTLAIIASASRPH